jgi:hypothetical protein
MCSLYTGVDESSKVTHPILHLSTSTFLLVKMCRLDCPDFTLVKTSAWEMSEMGIGSAWNFIERGAVLFILTFQPITEDFYWAPIDICRYPITCTHTSFFCPNFVLCESSGHTLYTASSVLKHWHIPMWTQFSPLEGLWFVTKVFPFHRRVWQNITVLCSFQCSH